MSGARQQTMTVMGRDFNIEVEPQADGLTGNVVVRCRELGLAAATRPEMAEAIDRFLVDAMNEEIAKYNSLPLHAKLSVALEDG